MRVVCTGYYECLGEKKTYETKVEQKLTKQRREKGKGVTARKKSEEVRHSVAYATGHKLV